jgi:L-amino acid N-acyltransferase YncA
MKISIRSANADDAAELLAIYAPYVERTAVSFEVSPPTVDEFAERIRKYSESWAWLVAYDANQILGYAYGSAHRERPAYRWSVETSAYVRPMAQRQGIGKQLYMSLLPTLTQKGFCNAYAGIALPNEASVALHRSVGFQPIGVFPAVGRKFDAWHDVAWLHQKLRDNPIK